RRAEPRRRARRVPRRGRLRRVEVERSDEQRLAPVTYLPGVQPPSDRAPDELDDTAPDPEAERVRAENVSLHALTRRAHSRRELERLLRSRGFDDAVIEHEVERLERVGLIDDVALAQ